MNTWFNYMVEANLCLCVLLGLYVLFLRHETSFRVQRIVLLAGSIAAVTLPLIHAGSARAQLAVSNYLPATWLPEVVVTPQGGYETSTADTGVWSSPLFLFYTGIGVVLLALLITRLIKVLLLIFKATVAYEQDGFKIVELPAPFTTFSFFHFIFLGGTEALSQQDKERMLRHELAHAKNYHSIDVLWINLVQAFFWINPLIAVYRKIFIQLHEFEADARAAKNDEVNEYCSLLAKVALESADFKLANHFSNSLIIKRINMIRTNKRNIAPWRMIILINCATSFFYFIVSSEQVVAQQQQPAPQDVSPSDEVFSLVDDGANYYPDGLKGLGEFISKNLKYDADARKKGIEGTVYVSFIVEKDGVPSDAIIVKGIDPALDAEARRVVLLTRWAPGKNGGKVVRSRFVLPIKYALTRKARPDQTW